METEKLAVIVLAIIIVAGLSAVIISNEDVLNMFNGGEKEAETVGDGIIAIYDCADVYFTERFASNNTIISTNIESVAIEEGVYDSENTYEPAQVFVDPDYYYPAPEGYEDYSSLRDMATYSFYLPKFLESLEGMKKGDNKTITLEGEDSYGDWNESLADMLIDQSVATGNPDPRLRSTPQELSPTFTKTYFSSYILPDLTDEYNISTIFEGQIFDTINGTLQNGENTTWQIEITNISDENVTVRNIIENGTIIKSEGIWDSTVIIVNETHFNLRSDPELNAVYGEPPFLIKIIDINDTNIRIAMNIKAPSVNLIGESIIFELEVVKVYDTAELFDQES